MSPTKSNTEIKSTGSSTVKSDENIISFDGAQFLAILSNLVETVAIYIIAGDFLKFKRSSLDTT